ncbi:hypothetical protein G6F35_012529 [Rhizopus arrhizus]|nr:hypothetical protein G6F35_012529 [Rhizopus arrhizus]
MLFTVLLKTLKHKQKQQQFSTNSSSILSTGAYKKKIYQSSKSLLNKPDVSQYMDTAQQDNKNRKPENSRRKLSNFPIVSNTWRLHPWEKNDMLSTTSLSRNTTRNRIRKNNLTSTRPEISNKFPEIVAEEVVMDTDQEFFIQQRRWQRTWRQQTPLLLPSLEKSANSNFDPGFSSSQVIPAASAAATISGDIHSTWSQQVQRCDQSKLFHSQGWDLTRWPPLPFPDDVEKNDTT